MSISGIVATALCLSELDVAALFQGRLISALTRSFISSGQNFALCPADNSLDDPTISIKAWAKLEFCKIYSDSQDLEKLSRTGIWTKEDLNKIIQERHRIFLTCLRVYQLPQPFQIPSNLISPNKIGGFIKLPSYISVLDSMPILSGSVFRKRQEQLSRLESPPHSQLESLEAKLAQFIDSCSDGKIRLAAENLNSQINTFLGWRNDDSKRNSLDLEWIKDISKLGHRSVEEDNNRKSNYQAGTDFEEIVRRSLEFLGFKVEESYNGGAGGLDLFCSKPYPLVGECKAGKSIPDRSAEELDRIGKRKLRENYSKAVKLIIGSGRPTRNLLESAEISQISIITAMTFEKLVELKANYPKSIDLLSLKEYLSPGMIDHRINEYIEKVRQSIQVRAHVVNLVKNHLDKTDDDTAGIDDLLVAYMYSCPPQPLERLELRDILIELSSPLTGYLGRRKDENGSDRFYFLCDFSEEDGAP